MPQSYKEYPSGSVTLADVTYAVPFKYLSIDDVNVIGFDGDKWVPLTLDASAPRDAVNKTVTLATAPNALYTKIRLYRASSTTQLVDFQNGSRLSESDLDTAYQQGLFAAQEVSEDASTSQFTAVKDASLQSGTSLSNFASQAFTGDNSSFSFNITAFTPQTTVAEAYRVSIDGVMQSPTDAYSIALSPAQITFLGTVAPPTGSKIVVVTAASAASAVSVDDVTIGLTSANKAEIKNLGVTNAKLAGGITQDKLAGSIPQSKLSLDLIDDDTFTIGVSATSLASSESIKAFVQGMRPKFVPLTGGTTGLTKTNQADGTTVTYNISDFTSSDSDFATSKITGLIVEGFVFAKTDTNLITATLPATGVSTVIARCYTNDSTVAISDSATSFIPINSDTSNFQFSYSVNNTSGGTYNQSVIRGAIIVPNL